MLFTDPATMRKLPLVDTYQSLHLDLFGLRNVHIYRRNTKKDHFVKKQVFNIKIGSINYLAVHDASLGGKSSAAPARKKK